jgi:MFS transporter, DHA1 family, multidrug resistance protein
LSQLTDQSIFLKGPVVGGFAAFKEDWRWPLYILIWLSSFTFLTSLVMLPETFEPTLLLRRAQRLRKLTGNDKITSQSEIDQAKITPKELILTSLWRPLRLSLEPAVFFLNLYLGLAYAIFYLWFEAFPLVFGGIYHFNLGLQGLPFLGIAVGTLLEYLIYALNQYYIVEPAFRKTGSFVPESILKLTLFGCYFIPVSLFFFGFTSRESVHWIAPIIAAGLYMPGLILFFQTFLAYLPTSYPKYAASVLAANSLVRSIIAGSFPLFGRSMFKTLGIAGGSSLLAGLSIVMIPPLYVSCFSDLLLQ